MIQRRVMAVCIVAVLAAMANDVKAKDDADQLRAIERERLHSLVTADLATARRLHADDFQLINPRGGTLTKDQYLADIASGDLDYLEWEPGEIQVRQYGDSAVLRYQARLRVSVRRSPGRPVTFWHTDLYEKRNGQWQVVWSHATLVEERRETERAPAAGVKPDAGEIAVSVNDTIAIELNSLADGTFTPAIISGDFKGRPHVLLNLSEEGSMRMLEVENHYDKTLKYSARICMAKMNRCIETSVLPVEAGLSAFESWGDPIDRIVFSRFLLVK